MYRGLSLNAARKKSNEDKNFSRRKSVPVVYFQPGENMEENVKRGTLDLREERKMSKTHKHGFIRAIFSDDETSKSSLRACYSPPSTPPSQFYRSKSNDYDEPSISKRTSSPRPSRHDVPQPFETKKRVQFSKEQFTSSGKCHDCYKQLQDFKKRFAEVRSHRQKYEILTSVSSSLVKDKDLMKEFGCPEMMAYVAAALRDSKGCFSSPSPQFTQHIPEAIRTSVAKFSVSLENSIELKGRENSVELMTQRKQFEDKTRCRTIVGIVQKRQVFLSLSELYHEYLFLNPNHRRQLSISRFTHLQTSNLVWSRPFVGNTQDICLIHENMVLLLSCCSPSNGDEIGRILRTVVCSDKKSLCMLGYCENCPMNYSIRSLTSDYHWDDEIDFYIWQNSQSLFFSGPEDEHHVELTHITEPISRFRTRFKTHIAKFLKHHFIRTSQKEYLHQMNSYLTKESVALIRMDFVEPYTPVIKTTAKKSTSHKFSVISSENALQPVPIAIHPFCIRFYDEGLRKLEDRYIVVISNDLQQNPTTSYIFRKEMLNWLKHTLPHVKSIIYLTDDNPKHYKNSENILNLMYHEEDFNLKASHEFTVEGHEMQECCTVATAIKRECRTACIKGMTVISSPEDMFKYCKQELTRYDLQFAFVDSSVSRIRTFEGRLQRRYKMNNGIIPGISHFYSFRPIVEHKVSNKLQLRRYSLSEDVKTAKISLDSTSIWIDDFQICSCSHQYDRSKLLNGNLLSVCLDGNMFFARVKDESRVRYGELEVTLLKRYDKKGNKDGELKVEANCGENGMRASISTLDVQAVDEMPIKKGRSGSWSYFTGGLDNMPWVKNTGKKSIFRFGKGELKRHSVSTSPNTQPVNTISEKK